MNEQVDALLRALANDDARTEAPPRVESAVMRAWRGRPVASGRWPVARHSLVAGGRWPVARRHPASARRRSGWVTLPLAAAAVLLVAIVLWRGVGVASRPDSVTQQATSNSLSAHPIETRIAAPAVPVASPQPRSGASAVTPVASNATGSNHEAPATGHRPPATGEQPPATGEQSPGTSDQPYVLVGASRSDAATLNVVRVRMARSALATLGLPLPNPEAAALVDVDVFVGEDGIARAIRPVALVGSVSQE